RTLPSRQRRRVRAASGTLARDGSTGTASRGWLRPPSPARSPARSSRTRSRSAFSTGHRRSPGVEWSRSRLSPDRPTCARTFPRTARRRSRVFIGVLGGAVGVILGTLRMPALVRSVGLDVRRAAGTNLVVGFLLGLAGFLTHAAVTGVEWSILGAGLAGAIPGGWLGAKATSRISENAL